MTEISEPVKLLDKRSTELFLEVYEKVNITLLDKELDQALFARIRYLESCAAVLEALLLRQKNGEE